jgi:hypothetical protein
MPRSKATSSPSRKRGSQPDRQAPDARPAVEARPKTVRKKAEPLDRAVSKPGANGAKPKKEQDKRTKPLNFRVTPEFRKLFKQAAAAEDVKKVELLERIFTEWQSRRP